jgi:hypothetical protein
VRADSLHVGSIRWLPDEPFKAARARHSEQNDAGLDDVIEVQQPAFDGT